MIFHQFTSNRRYTPAQVMACLQISNKTLSRYVNGYTYTYKGKQVHQPPILRARYTEVLRQRYFMGNDLNAIQK